MIKLYWSPRSRSFTTLWLMEESGLPYERVLTDISTGAQKAPDFLRVNPMGKVPALSDGDAALGEAAAICAYIADRYPETKLAPAVTDPRRARYLQWLFFSPGLHRTCHHPDLHQDRDPDLDRGLGQRDAGVRRSGRCARRGAVDSRRRIFGRRRHDRLGPEFRGAPVQDGAVAPRVRCLSRTLHGTSRFPARGEDRRGLDELS
ncbi:glutathione S-transferase [Bradyrhizobium ottawaense]